MRPFKTGMAIDAEGAPNAYHPKDIGLDSLKNAGFPRKPGERPWGIVTNVAGNPVTGKPGGPVELGELSRRRKNAAE